MKYYYLIFPSLVALSVGSIIGLFVKVEKYFLIFFALIIFSACIRSVVLKLKLTLLFFNLMLFLIFGVFWGNVFSSRFIINESIKNNLNKIYFIKALVVSNPTIKNNKQNFIVKTDDKYKVSVSYAGDKKIVYGMKIKLTGIMKQPENFISNRGKVVDYESIQRAKGILLIMDAKKAEILSEGEGSRIIKYLFFFKNKIQELVSRMKPPESNLLFSMVFGGKNNLDKNMIENFRVSGILHIVVLSGQNLTLIAMLSVIIFSYIFGFRIGHLVAILLVTIYTFIGGLESATLRAYFMSILSIILLLFGRVSNAGRILLFSVVLMVINNPYIFFYDPSFHLSILAFLGIIYVSPIVKNFLIKNNFGIKMSDYLSAILGAQILVLPYILYSSQTITIYSFLSNILILFIVELVTVYGVLLVLIGLFSNLIFDIFSVPIYFMLKYIIFISYQISKLPMSSIEINFSKGMLVVLYIFIFIYLFRRWRKPDLRPLSVFELQTNEIALKKGIIPYVEDVPLNDIVEKKEINWN